MKIRRARKSDLKQINNLCQLCSWTGLSSDFINKRDLSLVVVDDKKILGFMWVGIMANGTVGYQDWYLVHPELAGKGVGLALAQRMADVAKKKGVEILFAHVEPTPSAEKVLRNSEKIGMKVMPKQYTLLLGLTKEMGEK